MTLSSPAPTPAPARNTLELAASIIGRADRSHPADLVLRESLRRLPGLSRLQSGEVSRTVFAFYRWHGWLDHRRPLPVQIKRAVELAQGYAQRPQSFSDEKLLLRSLPDWTASQVEVSADWVRALQAEPKLWLRARPGQASHLARKLDHAKACGLLDAVLYSGPKDLFRSREFRSGDFQIQDLSSQAVGRLCSPQPGETWWDACAGEGGKALHLSDLMGNQGLIWATDRAQWRLQRLKLRAARARCFNIRLVPWDGRAPLPFKTLFDGVLVDAPCSGLGTWQRNPHARWTTTPDDVRELAAIQKGLLLCAAAALKPGGKLVYAVCTLTRAETIEVADHVERTLEGFEPLPLPDLFHPEAAPASRGWLWPQDSGGNGMFVAAWRKSFNPSSNP